MFKRAVCRASPVRPPPNIVRTFAMATTSPAAAAAAAAAAAPPAEAEATYKPRYIDIGINLADPIFRGKYHGTQRHPDDLAAVVGRAQEVGCSKLMVTGSDFETSRDALKLADEYREWPWPCLSVLPLTANS
jgi:hypothetical protein